MIGSRVRVADLRREGGFHVYDAIRVPFSTMLKTRHAGQEVSREVREPKRQGATLHAPACESLSSLLGRPAYRVPGAGVYRKAGKEEDGVMRGDEKRRDI